MRRFVRWLSHWAWLLALAAAVAASATFLVSQRLAPVYRATATLLVDEGNAPGYERRMQGYMALLESPAAVAEAVERLSLDLPTADLAGQIHLFNPPDSPLLQVSVDYADPDTAAAIANSLSATFIARLDALNGSRLDPMRQNAQASLAAAAAEVVRLEGLVADFGEADSEERRQALARLEEQVRAARLAHDASRQSLDFLRLQSAQAAGTIAVIEPATAPAMAARPRVAANTLLAAVAGALAVAAAILIVERLDSPIKSTGQLTAETGLPVLGQIASFHALRDASGLIARNRPGDPVSEAFRRLQINLSFTDVDGGLRAVLLTSPGAGEGKTTVISNLAVVMAQMGRHVVLVDANLQGPRLHQVFGLRNELGLTSAILDDVSVVTHLQESGTPGLLVLTSGPPPPDPAGLLGSRRMKRLLDDLMLAADSVLVDSAPVLAGPDTAALAQHIDQSLLVIVANSTRRKQLAQAQELLRSSGSRTAGVIFNRQAAPSSASDDFANWAVEGIAPMSGWATQRTRPGRRTQVASTAAGDPLARRLANVLFGLGVAIVLIAAGYYAWLSIAGADGASPETMPVVLRLFFAGMLLAGAGLVLAPAEVPARNAMRNQP